MIFRAHLRLVHGIARKMTCPRGAVDIEDLLQEGCTGLLKAIARYRSSYTGSRFYEYAYSSIYHAMIKAVRKENRQSGHESYRGQSLKTPGTVPRRAWPSGHWVDVVDDPETCFCRKETGGRGPFIRSLIVQLPRRAQTLIKNRYGFDRLRPARTLHQCGRRFGLSVVEVWRLEQHAIALLRLYAKEEGISHEAYA